MLFVCYLLYYICLLYVCCMLNVIHHDFDQHFQGHEI